jgi:sugar phosphate isomerase/epimerase
VVADPGIARLSLNQATTEPWSLAETVDGCARAHIPAIGLWRHKVAEAGLQQSARLVRDAGLRVSSLCRGGMFVAASADERAARIDDNRRAIHEAAELGAPVLVLVCGGLVGRDIGAARQMVIEGIAAIVPDASACGIRLGIEPLHPMYAADRSVIVTLAEALLIAEQFPSQTVGVVIDVYHVWWDPQIDAQIARARGRIVGLHVNDWLTPLPDPLLGRGMMGDGVIDVRRLRRAVDAAGYDGPIEVEIFNRAIWNMPGDVVLARVCEAYRAYV